MAIEIKQYNKNWKLELLREKWFLPEKSEDVKTLREFLFSNSIKHNVSFSKEIVEFEFCSSTIYIKTLELLLEKVRSFLNYKDKYGHDPYSYNVIEKEEKEFHDYEFGH